MLINLKFMFHNMKIMDKSNVFLIDPEKCTGCRLCEIACSFFHYKIFSPRRARIKAVRLRDESRDVPITCVHCRISPPCIGACPVEAIYRDEKIGAIKIIEEKCIGCMSCSTHCPFGAIVLDTVSGRVVKCDLCNGKPKCVEYCPTKAITYAKADLSGLLKKICAAERFEELTRTFSTRQQ